MKVTDRHRELFEALGRVVVAFSGLEDTLRDAVGLVLGTRSPAIPVLTAGLAFRTLVEKFGAVWHDCALAPATSGISDADLADICKDLNALNDERNSLIHSTWVMTRDEHPSVRTKSSADARTGLEFKVTEVAVEDVRALAARIERVEVRLLGIAFASSPRETETPGAPS